MNVPRGGEAEAKARRELAGYYAHIEATDRAIGRLLDGVREDLGGLDDVLVVFTSVHGDMHGAHGLFRKGWPHEEAVRVPLLVKLPGKGEERTVKGEMRENAAALENLPGAMCDYVDRGSFDLAGDGAARISMPSVVALPHQCDRVWRGVRTATRKLVLNADGTPWLFFDLENDPLETRNLVGELRWAAEIRALARNV